MSRYILCCFLLMTCGQARFAEAQSKKSFSPLTRLAEEDALRLYYGVDYINREKELFNEVIVKKSGRIRMLLGSVSKLSRFNTAQRDKYSALYRNQSVLYEDVTKSASTLKDRSEKEAKQLAVLLYDLAVTIDPEDVEAAYERECLLVKEDVIIPWLEARKTIYRFEVEKGKRNEMSGTSIDGLKRSQALVKGLLVQELRGSQFLGEASQMNATVIRHGNSSEEMTVTFNQKVGSMMSDAVDDMLAFHRKRQEKLPSGISVEISFEEQYIPKDGPSAGVASALLLESLLRGTIMIRDSPSPGP